MNKREHTPAPRGRDRELQEAAPAPFLGTGHLDWQALHLWFTTARVEVWVAPFPCVKRRSPLAGISGFAGANGWAAQFGEAGISATGKKGSRLNHAFMIPCPAPPSPARCPAGAKPGLRRATARRSPRALPASAC